MDNFFQSQIENSKKAVKYWWLLLLLGIAIFVTGVVVFAFPAESYLSMALVFGLLMLFSGVFQVVLAGSNKNYVTGRGWMLAGGIIEILLGLILSFNVALSAATLPIFLGFWLLFRSFSLIGLGSDMSSAGIGGSGWTIFTAILLLICSIIILAQPYIFGVQMVVIWVGISLLMAGISTSVFAVQLRSVHKHFNKM
ncbi:MAG: DUF308 domain-containing protein [Rikenellaceae bacterium]|nr:DUF308 domain-containing protein [Rikenellaceae bacterium]